MIKIFCIDIDGVIVHRPDSSKYPDDCIMSANKKIIDIVNKLYDEGNYIKIFTARGTATKYDWVKFTNEQLNLYGVKFHELIFGKPNADYYIDDHNISIKEFVEIFK